jgi:dTDP-glucose 4,6-dehydratase
MTDLEFIANSNVPWECFENKSIFVTGATGLLGSVFIKGLLARNELHNSNIRVIAHARNRNKAEQIFSGKELSFVYGDIIQKLNIDEPIDYIVHGANPTASKEFEDFHVKTIKTI